MSKRTSIARVVCSVLAALVALGLTIGLTGCSKNDEEQVRADASELLDAFTAPTRENLQPYIEGSGVDMSTLDENGIDRYEFAEHALKHFSYTIDEVNVDGDAAVVKVTINNADLDVAMDAAIEDIQASIDQYEDMLIQEDGEKLFMQEVYKKLYEQLDKEDATMKESKVTLTYHKEGDSWVIDDDSVTSLCNAIFGGFGA